MKGDLIFSILEKLGDSATNSIDLFCAYLNAGYGANIKKINYELYKIRQGKKINNNKIKKDKDRFNKFIFSLKKDGLIEKKGTGSDAIFYITKKGVNKFKKIKETNNYFLPEINYLKPEGNVVILISFDVPEKRRKERNWLRGVLNYLEFKQIHQSVFVGKGKLPKNFIDDLKDLKLFDFIEIIEVGKMGTLKSIK
jgi:predicted transcriptional regulator